MGLHPDPLAVCRCFDYQISEEQAPEGGIVVKFLVTQTVQNCFIWWFFFFNWIQKLTSKQTPWPFGSQKGNHGIGLKHSQTQWFCRLQSHFLLGEVSQSNKAGWGPHGRVSTPGWDKLLTPFLSPLCSIRMFICGRQFLFSQFWQVRGFVLGFWNRFAFHHHSVVRLHALWYLYCSFYFSVLTLSRTHFWWFFFLFI